MSSLFLWLHNIFRSTEMLAPITDLCLCVLMYPRPYKAGHPDATDLTRDFSLGNSDATDILTLGLGLGLGRVLGLELGRQVVPDLKKTAVNFLASGRSRQDVAYPTLMSLRYYVCTLMFCDLLSAPFCLRPYVVDRFLYHQILLKKFHQHYSSTTQKSSTYSLCSVGKSYVQCPLLFAVLFLCKKRLWQSYKSRRIFAQATSHNMLDQVTRCCINTEETGSMLRSQTLGRSRKMSVTRRKSAEITRSSGGLGGIVSGIIHIAILWWCRKLARCWGVFIVVALPTSLRGMRTWTTCLE